MKLMRNQRVDGIFIKDCRFNCGKRERCPFATGNHSEWPQLESCILLVSGHSNPKKDLNNYKVDKVVAYSLLVPKDGTEEESDS